MTRRDDERGATAVIVSLMAVILIGLSAFVADFGLAYANKRAAQTAADAAALGAAGVFATQEARQCADMLSSGTGAANAEATSKVTANGTLSAPGTMTLFDPSCVGGDLQVRVTVEAPSPNFFGRILGRTSDYVVQRSAAAVVEAAVTGPRLRPMALCASDAIAAVAVGDAFRLTMPGDGGDDPETCPLDAGLAGNWWTLDCPLENNFDGNGTSALEQQIRNGCSEPISVVPGQGNLSGMALNNVLSSACPSVSTSAPFTCLSGDPGQPNSGHIESAWDDLIDAGTVVPVPVFCSKAPGKCAVDSIFGTGQNAVFPVHKLIAVQVCGYHFGKQPPRRYKPAAAKGYCAEPSAETLMNQLASDNTEDVYLVLAAANLQVSNVTADSSCRLGDDCDGGLRQIRMTSGGFDY